MARQQRYHLRERGDVLRDDTLKTPVASQMHCDACSAQTVHLYRHDRRLLCAVCHDIATHPERLPLTTWTPKSWRTPA